MIPCGLFLWFCSLWNISRKCQGIRDGSQAILSLIFLRSTKWRTHSNLVVNCDVMSLASCAHKQELIKLLFIMRAGRQSGGLAITSHFLLHHILVLRHVISCDKTYGEHVSRLYELRLCAGSFFHFFPVSRRRFPYFVLSALGIGEYKRFDSNLSKSKEIVLVILLC